MLQVSLRIFSDSYWYCCFILALDFPSFNIPFLLQNSVTLTFLFFFFFWISKTNRSTISDTRHQLPYPAAGWCTWTLRTWGTTPTGPNGWTLGPTSRKRHNWRSYTRSTWHRSLISCWRELWMDAKKRNWKPSYLWPTWTWWVVDICFNWMSF